MQIKVNGETAEVAEQTTIAKLLEMRQLKPERVAIEVNRRLVRGSDYGRTLKEGDEVEIVTFVGGG